MILYTKPVLNGCLNISGIQKYDKPINKHLRLKIPYTHNTNFKP